MEKYIKLNVSFWDRIRFLFLGVLKEDLLPTMEKEKVIEKYYGASTPQEIKNINNEEEEKFTIPFFDDTSDTESNL